jgi:hypothetical protein
MPQTFKQFLEEARRPVDLRSGRWKVQNLAGFEKTFSNIDSPEARAWMKSRDVVVPREVLSQQDKEYRKWEREQDKLDREERSEKRKQQTLDNIYHVVITQVGESWPDGDPLDRLHHWMIDNDITMEMIDRAFKKHEKKTYYKYLADMWDSMADDAIFDAENGNIDPNSPYYDVTITDPKQEKQFYDDKAKYRDDRDNLQAYMRKYGKHHFMKGLHDDEPEDEALKNIPPAPPTPKEPKITDYGVKIVKTENPWK